MSFVNSFFSYFQISCIYDSSSFGFTLFKLAAKMAIEMTHFPRWPPKGLLNGTFFLSMDIYLFLNRCLPIIIHDLISSESFPSTQDCHSFSN